MSSLRPSAVGTLLLFSGFLPVGWVRGSIVSANAVLVWNRTTLNLIRFETTGPTVLFGGHVRWRPNGDRWFPSWMQ